MEMIMEATELNRASFRGKVAHFSEGRQPWKHLVAAGANRWFKLQKSAFCNRAVSSVKNCSIPVLSVIHCPRR